ncbi:hypothetical protein [Corynebacterium suranareeae]|uniref:hypothetical protein n=1 Tax=Corynebacterium suranareeae TaxID=2506452 RepID=UPI0012FDC46D|nr:hypothetical protein [Corynebacterium suranareeae]
MELHSMMRRMTCGSGDEELVPNKPRHRHIRPKMCLLDASLVTSAGFKILKPA